SVASIQVYKTLNLRRMARTLELSYRQLRQMNPSFVRGYVPRSKDGYRLRVPLEYKWTVKRHLWGRPNLVMLPQPEEDDLALAGQFAEDTDFDVRTWLLGCSSENVVYDAPVMQRELEKDWTLAYYDSFATVAMLD
ncbi:MAG: hypothetical protein AAFN92_13785, partial [Bacteroidota bacterium]